MQQTIVSVAPVSQGMCTHAATLDHDSRVILGAVLADSVAFVARDLCLALLDFGDLAGYFRRQRVSDRARTEGRATHKADPHPSSS